MDFDKIKTFFFIIPICLISANITSGQGYLYNDDLELFELSEFGNNSAVMIVNNTNCLQCVVQLRDALMDLKKGIKQLKVFLIIQTDTGDTFIPFWAFNKGYDKVLFLYQKKWDLTLLGNINRELSINMQDHTPVLLYRKSTNCQLWDYEMLYNLGFKPSFRLD